MDYIKKLTDELVEKILAKGVRDMPQNPAAQGYSERQIREYYFKPESEILQLMMEMEDSLIRCFKDLNLEIKDKQDKLTSGDNITITEEGVISSTGGSNIEVDSELGESENPVQNKVIKEALGGKVNKVDKGSSVLVYTNDDNDGQTTIHYLGNNNNTYAPYNIPMIYGSTAGGSAPGTGYLITNTPLKPYHCANKKFVEEKVKLWKHNLEFFTEKPDGGYGCFSTVVLSFQSTSFAPNEVPFLRGQTLFDLNANKFVNVYSSSRNSYFTTINDSGIIEEHSIVADGSLSYNDFVAEYTGG